MKTLIGIFIFILVIVGVAISIIRTGKRNARKPLTLDELDERVHRMPKNPESVITLKIMIKALREQLTEEKDNYHQGSTHWLGAVANLKRLESIETTFQFRFVEFTGSFKNPVKIGKTYCDSCGHKNEEICNTCTLVNQPDSCCGVYEDSSRKENPVQMSQVQ